jgi:hypothetical protein
MELRRGRVEEGEVLALWRHRKWRNVYRGSFFLRRRQDDVDEAVRGGFEVLIVQSALAILEEYLETG